MTQIVINRSLCKKDQLCIRECPASIIRSGADGFPEIDVTTSEYCIGCGHCQAVCPCDALTLNNIAPSSLQKAKNENLAWPVIEGLIKSRRSIRNFTKKPVAPELLDKLFDLTRWAPTGGNSQLVKWLLIEKESTIMKICSAVADWARTNDTFKHIADAWDNGQDMILRNAPQLVIAYSGNGYGSTSMDCLIAATTFDLAAQSQGVGSCWAGFFLIACAQGYKPLIDLLELPAEHRVYAALMIGYSPYTFNRVPQRKEISLIKR